MGCGPGSLQGKASVSQTGVRLLVSDVFPYCQYLILRLLVVACGTERRREDLLVWHMTRG